MDLPYDCSLCWLCKKASGGQGCNFVDDTPSGATPIRGWQAREKKIKSSNIKKTETIYIVQDCPLFERG